MTQIEKIERAVEGLDQSSYAVFRAWFLDYENSRWEAQIRADSSAGKLDSLIEEARAEYRSGTTRPL